MALAGWSPPRIEGSPLKGRGGDPLNSLPQMATHDRVFSPPRLGGILSCQAAWFEEADDMPFDDDQSSIAESSNGSAEMAMLEAQLALETDLLEAAEHMVCQAAAKMAALKAGNGNSYGSDMWPRGSRRPCTIAPPDALPAKRRLTLYCEPGPTSEELEEELADACDEYGFDPEMGSDSYPPAAREVLLKMGGGHAGQVQEEVR